MSDFNTSERKREKGVFFKMKEAQKENSFPKKVELLLYNVRHRLCVCVCVLIHWPFLRCRMQRGPKKEEILDIFVSQI